MPEAQFYPVGTPGEAWGESEKRAWLEHAGVVKRSYEEEVLARVRDLGEGFEVSKYGALSLDKGRYPLYVIKSGGWDPATKPTVLITG